MSTAADVRAIETRFDAQWGLTPIKWGNVDPGADVINAQRELKPWARITVRGGGEEPHAFGSRVAYRRLGMIAIDIFVAPNRGTHDAKRLADEAARIFRGARFADIKCVGASITERELTGGTGLADRDTQGGWYSIMVLIPYRRDEVFAELEEA